MAKLTDYEDLVIDWAKKRRMELRKNKRPDCKTVAVRFPNANKMEKLYTYRVRKGAVIKLGDMLAVDTDFGPKIVFVLRVDKTPVVPDGFGLDGLKWITHKVVEL